MKNRKSSFMASDRHLLMFVSFTLVWDVSLDVNRFQNQIDKRCVNEVVYVIKNIFLTNDIFLVWCAQVARTSRTWINMTVYTVLVRSLWLSVLIHELGKPSATIILMGSKDISATSLLNKKFLYRNLRWVNIWQLYFVNRRNSALFKYSFKLNNFLTGFYFLVTCDNYLRIYLCTIC